MIALLFALGTWLPQTMAAPRCEQQQELVVLWHKETPAAARNSVGEVLKQACFRISESFDGTRREATEMAALLEIPLLAVKALIEEDPDGARVVVVGLDVIDTAFEELKIKATADARAPAPPGADARTWRKQTPLIEQAFAQVRAALR